jgi:aspartate/methionine/tyrosine aminotransferase
MSMVKLLEYADEECESMWNHLRLGYTETKGLPQLREACAAEYGLAPENILCFAGAEEGIYCALQSLLVESDHAIVITPCYQSLLSVAAAICEVTSVNLTSSWSLDFSAIAAAIRPGTTKLIVVNFPHNPTGATVSPEEQRRLIALAVEFDLWIFWDEVYRGVELNDRETLPSIASIYHKGVSLGAMSKVYGMAGLRIGWICCRDFEMLNLIADSKHYLSIANSGPSEILALIAIRSKEKIVSNIKSIIVTNLAAVDECLSRNSGWLSWVRPSAGCCGLMRVKLPSGLDMDAFAARLVNEYGVLILPASKFLIIHDTEFLRELESHFRIGFARSSFPQALAEFERASLIIMADYASTTA